MAARIAVVDSEQQSLAFHFERDFGFRGGHQAALIVENLDGEVRHVAAIGGDRVTIRRQANRGWLTGSDDFYRGSNVAIFDANGFDGPWFVRHIPRQMQVSGSSEHPGACGIIAVLACHAQTGEFVSLYAKRPAIQKEFDGVAIGVTGDGNDLSFSALPVPVREEMKYWLVRPLALIEVKAVFFEAACIQNSGRRTFHWPACFAKMVEAGPHEIAGDVIVGADK